MIRSKLWLLSLLIAGCADNARLPSSSTTDSAGVRIVESLRASWGDEARWFLDSVPMISIGTEGGDEDYQLYRARSARRLLDGSIVVSNTGTSELRFFDSAGTFVQSTSRRGGGPGEFSELSSMRIWQSPNGRLVVTDDGNARINLFSPNGVFETSIRLSGPSTTPRAWLVDTFGDESWVVMGPIGGGRIQGPPGSIIEMSFAYLRYSPAGEFIRELVQVADRPRYVHESGGVTHFPYIPFAQEPLVTAHKNGLIVLTADASGLERIDATGQLESLIRWNLEARLRTEAVWPRYKSTAVEQIPDERRRRLYARYYEEDLPLPEYIPLADAIVVDDADYIWVRRHQLPWQREPTWDILSPTGNWLGTLTTPSDMTVYEIGLDYVLGAHRDSLGVERIQIFALHRS